MKTRTRSMNPFPGLRPFRQEEDYLFFGREEQTMELLQLLGSRRFVAVVGTSGSGKSSLVRCGLLSELLGGKLRRAGTSWEVAVTHPGGDPLALLAEALLEADIYDREEENARENLLATLTRSQFGLVEAIRQARLGDGVNFLLVVDQFEEIFRFNEAGQRQQEVANEFVSLLLEAVAQTAVPIYIVLTMRSDFIGDCGQFEGLAEMVTRGEFLIPRLSREQFKRVIEAPIRVAGGRIAPRLLQRLLNDLGQQADQLPCLQHALMRTWSIWSERGDGGPLDLDDYQRVGRMSEALSLHADEIYAGLEDDRQRELCAGMFKALTVQESENRGIRRPQRLGALCQILDVPADELRPIIDAFRQPHVTFLMPSSEVALSAKTIIDISHESLMRVWTRLRNWVDEEAQAAGIYRRLSESALLHAHGKAGFYRDPELGIALAWREAARPNEAWASRYYSGFGEAMAFLEASHQASIAEEEAREAARQRELEQARILAEAERARAETETRSARRLRALLVGTALVAVLAVGASVVAFNFWRDAERAKQAAQLSERSAKANALLAQREAERATTQEAAANQARQEAEVRAYTASLAAAAADLERNDSQTLRRRLEQAPRRMRGWEWSYLWNESDRSLRTTLALPPERDGYYMDLSRDGMLVATRPAGGNDKPVTIYDTRTGAQVAVLTTYSSSNPLMTFSGDNRLLAFDHQGTQGVQIFDIRSGRPLVPNPRTFGGFLGFDPAGERAVVFDMKGKLHIFKTADWSPDADLPGQIHIGTVDARRRGAISPDGKRLAIGSMGGEPTRIYDLTSRTLQKEIPESTTAAAVRWNDRGDVLTTMSADGGIVHYSATDWRKVAETREGRQQRGGLAIHRLDGGSLGLSFDSNGAVVLYDPRLTMSAKLHGHGAPGLSIAVDKELEQIVTTHRDGAVCRWDLRHPQDSTLVTATDVLAPPPHVFSASAVAFTPDGSATYVGTQGSAMNGAIQLCAVDVTSGGILGYLRWYAWSVAHSSRASQMAYSPDGRKLAVCTKSGWQQGRWRIYDLWTGIALHGMEVPDGDLQCIDWSSDGRWIAIGGTGGSARIYDAETYREMAVIDGHKRVVNAVSFSRDGQRLATAAEDGTLRIWKTPGGQSLTTIGKPGDSALNCLIQSPDGTTMVAGSSDGTLTVWDALDGKERFRGKVHGAAVTCLRFTPDGTRLVTAAADQSLKVFDPTAWRELVTLHLPTTARALSFSPDGKRLGLAMGALVFLDAEDETMRSRERRLARESDRRARPLVQRALEKTADPLQAREMIAKEAAGDEATRNAALRGLRTRLDSRWRDAYEVEKLDAMVSAQVLVQQLVRRAHEHLPTSLKGQLIDSLVRRLPNPDAIERQAIAEFVSSRLNWEQPAPQEMAWEIVSNPGRDPDDHLLVYLGLEPVVRQNPLDADCQTTMAMAEFRVGLYADAIESARRGASMSRNAGQLGAQGLAVVAMSQHKMGQSHAAAETMRKLEELMKKPPLSADQPAVALRDEARKVLAAPVDKPWNERAAWDSCKARLEATVGPARCAIWQLRSLERKAGGHLEPLDNARLEAARKEARVSLEAELVKSPDDGSLAQALADLLLDEHDHETTRWTVLEPITMKSQGGAMLTKLADHSILAGGVNPEHDTYTFMARTDLAKLAAFRLEAMADESLPRGGPGRAESGNFALSEISVKAQPPSGSGEATAVKLIKPRADFEQYRFPAAASLDGDPGTAWSIDPQVSMNHEAFFEVGSSEQAGLGGGTELTFTLDFRSGNRQSLGRFRLSVTGDSAGLAQDGDRRAARTLADPWAKLAAAYAIAGDGAKAARWFVKALDEAEAYLARPSVVAYRNGRFHISRQRPETAVAGIAQAIERQPKNLLLHYGRSLLLVASGDRTALRRASSDLLEQFRGTTNPSAAVDVAWFCVLGGDAVADHEAVVRLAEFAVNAVPAEYKGRFMTTFGGALYRAGRFEESIRRLEEGNRLRHGQSTPRDWAFLALAHHQLGHRAEARRWLDRLRAYRADEAPDAFWNEWTGRGIFWSELATHLLRSEAEACILFDPIFPSDPFVH